MGDYETLHVDEKLFVYGRTYGTRTYIVALNFSDDVVDLHVRGETVLSTVSDQRRSDKHLLPLEGRILNA